MTERSYWENFRRVRLNRRRVLASAGAGLAAAGLAACATPKQTSDRSSQASTGSANQGPTGNPQSGGTLNVFLPYNPPLDPQKVSAAAQAAVGGTYSRL